ncbi:hypothetical protein X945_5054 [Burkholderia pseudomallei ABCPW 107]|nr:hypothetical protein X945_5054 [Burkholderia pseudomallei ABCPW 107]
MAPDRRYRPLKGEDGGEAHTMAMITVNAGDHSIMSDA